MRCFSRLTPPFFLLMVSTVLTQGRLCAAPDLPPEMERRLQDLKLSYEGFVLKNATFPYEAAIKALNAVVLPALEREATSAAQRKDLDSLVRIKADVERVKSGALLTETQELPPSSLKNIYATYQLELGKIEAARKAKTADAVRRYDQGLKLIQDEMTMTQQVEAALAVKQLRDGLQQEATNKPPRISALEASATPPTATSPFTNSLGMNFVTVPGTSVQMCVHETRNSDYAAFAEATSADSAWRNVSVYGLKISDGDKHPVTNVSWEDATAFCQWLSEKEKLTYRLPTDREWSFAVGIANEEDSFATPLSLSGKLIGRYPWGTSWPPNKEAGNYADEHLKKASTLKQVIEGFSDGFSGSAPVMAFPPNELGFYDLGGNVWEWCEDRYNKDELSRVLRGGAWSSPEKEHLLSSARFGMAQNLRRWMTGFRVVLVNREASHTSQHPVPAGKMPLDELVRNLGGSITSGSDGLGINFTAKRLTTAELLQLGAFKKIQAFDWNGGGGLEDAGMAAFEGMRDLYGLMLWSVGKFSDEGLRYLKNCRKLEYLNIGSNTGDFTGEGLKYLVGCSELRSLTLNFSGKFEGKNLRHLIGLRALEDLLMSGCRGVADEHVDLLLQMPSLTTLMLRGTSISDKGLLKLAALPGLKEVHASGPTISQECVVTLKRAFPELKVEYITP